MCFINLLYMKYFLYSSVSKSNSTGENINHTSGKQTISEDDDSNTLTFQLEDGQHRGKNNQIPCIYSDSLCARTHFISCKVEIPFKSHINISFRLDVDYKSKMYVLILEVLF